MEPIAALIGLGLVALALLAPILVLVSFVRVRRLQGELAELGARLAGLEARVEGLAKRLVSDRIGEAKPQPAAPAAPRPASAAPPPVTATAERSQLPAPPKGPTPPSGPAFDWESLVGLKGAAWLGGVTLVIASLFFARWTFEQGLITPPLRIACLVAAGILALVWAELSLRRGFTTTANAVSGAGIAILYVAFFAGHSLYQLFPLAATFALMALVTLTAGLLAIRYDAQFTAVLGLLGGFATPLVLSTGVDHPVGLFSYLLLLNLGLLAVALHRRWHGLVPLGLLGTLLIQAAWFFRFMSPAKMVIGLSAFLVFGLLYLLAPSAFGEGNELAGAEAVGGMVPFAFGLLLAGNASYSGRWPLLFGYVALLGAALVAVALRRGRTGLLIAGSSATTLLLSLWAASGLRAAVLWGPILGAVGLVTLFNLPSRMAPRAAVSGLRSEPLEGAGLIASGGLLAFAIAVVVRGLGEPPWAFSFLLLALLALLVERTGEHRLPHVLWLGASALAGLVQLWFFRQGAGGNTLLRDLSLPLLLPLALSLVAAIRARAPVDATDDEAAVVASTGFAVLGLFGCLGSPERGGDPRPLFAALAVADLLLVVSALRRGWARLVPAALAASALLLTAWHQSYFQRDDLSVALPAYGAFCLAFLALPFALPRGAARSWEGRSAPWLSAALSAPAFFLVLYRAFVAGWGKAWIGALPVALAAVSVAALALARRRFGAAADGGEARLRLRHLAAFAAVALGFLTLAIPLQLDRQWITVGWALEALALWWLFGRLPHAGLKYLGAALFVAVGVRLLLNPEVLRYEERGLRILNWLLYTYGVPALCCFLGAAALRRAEAARPSAAESDVLGGDRTQLAPAAALLGLLLVFWLINLEVADFFSVGRYLEFNLERHFARDLSLSVAWGVYAMMLLVLGLLRAARGLRMVSLAFLVLTVAKVFLYDLSNLTGLYRVLSFLGLGLSLILVSLLYQRFMVSRREER